MCGKGTNTTTSSQTSNSSPAAQQAIQRANQVSQTPYTAYGGEMVSPFTGLQNQAFGQIQSSQGIGTPYLNQAANYAQQGASPITSADINSTLNSTGLNNQITSLQNLYNQQNATANSTVTGNAAAQGALGGDRVGVAQALTQQANTLAQAPALASAENTAYAQAANIAQANKAAQAGAAYTYGNLGQEAQNQSTTDIQNELTGGGLQQQLGQAQDTWNYQNNYLNPQAWPYQNAQWYSGILGSLGGLTGSQSSTTQPSPSLFSQLLGAGTSLGGAYLLSDAAVKDNISEPLGFLNDGTPVRSFNYKGSPQTQMGVIAQEAEQRNPNVVAQDPATGIKMVDYSRVGRPGLAEPFSSGGAVDSDFARLTNHVGHAVKHLRGMLPDPAMAAPQGYAPGGSIGMPTELSAKSINYALPTASNPIPTSQGGGSNSGMMQAPQPTQQQQPSYMTGVNSLAQGLGHYMSTPTSTVDPGTAANGGWTTTTTPAGGIGSFLSGLFSQGGEVHGGPEPEHMAAGGMPYYLRPMVDDANGGPQAPESPVGLSTEGAAGGSLGSGSPFSTQGAQMATPFDATSNIPGAGAHTALSNVVKPDRNVGDAPLPPTATPYQPPQAAPTQTGSIAPAAPDQGGEEASPEAAKKWYEYGSNPTLGMALLQAGGNMMAGTSPFAGVNIGQGIVGGANAYIQQKQIERQSKALEIQAARQAEIERHNQAIEQLQLSNQPKWTSDQYGRLYNQKTGQYKEDNGGGLFAPGANGALPSGDEMLARVPPQIRAQVKAIGEYDAAMPTGIKGQAISDLVHSVYPNYDQTQYPVAQATKKEFSPAGQTGKSFASVNTSLRHIDDLWEAYKHLGMLGGDAWFPQTRNELHNWSASNAGGKEGEEYQYWINKFNGAKKGISTELDKAMKGSGTPDVTGIEDIKRGFDPTTPVQGMRGNVEATLRLLKGKLDGANIAYQQGTGGKTDMIDKWLQPDAKKIYDKFLDPDWGSPEAEGRPQSEGGPSSGAASPADLRKLIQTSPDNTPFTVKGKPYVTKGGVLVPAGEAP
jgi:hypothetical protein